MPICKTDRDCFIEENLGLVHAICKRFAGKGIDYEDLYQAGSLGLVKAADAFDRERGICFSTYAFPVIMGEIRRLFRDGGAVKISRSVKELGIRISKERQMAEQRLMREPSVSELAATLAVSPEEITEAICAMRPTVSLTLETEDGVRDWQLPAVDHEEEITDKLTVAAGLSVLDEEEKNIILCRYYRGMTQSKTAKVLSMTQVQVSRKEKRILEKMRNALSV